MILTKVTLTDFGVFQGRQTISLTPQPSRPIILIGGKNGAGKTTLLEAIQLCLYGARAYETAVSREAYLTRLQGLIHSSPSLLIQPTFASVSVEFQYADHDGLHSYHVTRSWEQRSWQKTTEYLDIQRDGKALDELSAEHWDDFLRDLIPPGVSRLFFFDGEKIQHLAEDTSDQQTLAEAVKALLGLDVIERLQVDLGIYLSRLSKQSQIPSLAEEIEELSRQLEQAKQDISDKRTARKAYDQRLAELRETIARQEARIASAGGGFARIRESLLKRQASLKTLIGQHEEMLRQMGGGLLPFALAPNLLRKLRNQLRRDQEAFLMKAGLGLLDSIRSEFRQRLAGFATWPELAEVPSSIRDALYRRLERMLHEATNLETKECSESLHQISSNDYHRLLSWIDDAVTQVPAKAKELAAELERYARELHRVENELRKAPVEEILKPLFEQLHQAHEAFAKTAKEASLIDEEIRLAEQRLSDLQRRWATATQRLQSDQRQGSRLTLIPRIQNALEDYGTALLERKVRQLEATVSDCFNRLCRKTDTVRRISIDPKDFLVRLYDERNRAIPKARLSAGEKQIYAISMLWALAKTSGRPLPMIIDTPLARLDSDHRSLLVDNYFPCASHQVIILSTDTEVDQRYFSRLRRSISHAYRLEFNLAEKSTRILDGYFQNGAECA